MENKDLKFDLSLELYPATGVWMALPWMDLATKTVHDRASVDSPPEVGFYIGSWTGGADTEDESAQLTFSNHFDGFCGYLELFLGTVYDTDLLWEYLSAMAATPAAMVEVDFPMGWCGYDQDCGHRFSLLPGAVKREFGSNHLYA